jgi:hypothetical protein
MEFIFPDKLYDSSDWEEGKYSKPLIGLIFRALRA